MTRFVLKVMIVFVLRQNKGKGTKQIQFSVTGDLTSLLHSLPLQSKHWCQRCWTSNVPLLCKKYSTFSKHGRLSRLYVVLLVFAPCVKMQDPKPVAV
jgi:hypothetical protein